VARVWKVEKDGQHWGCHHAPVDGCSLRGSYARFLFTVEHASYLTQLLQYFLPQLWLLLDIFCLLAMKSVVLLVTHYPSCSMLMSSTAIAHLPEMMSMGKQVWCMCAKSQDGKGPTVLWLELDLGWQCQCWVPCYWLWHKHTRIWQLSHSIQKQNSTGIQVGRVYMWEVLVSNFW